MPVAAVFALLLLGVVFADAVLSDVLVLEAGAWLDIVLAVLEPCALLSGFEFAVPLAALLVLL